MSRFLTASKIGLLALISLYTEGIIPVLSSSATISFLLSRIIPDSRRPVAEPVRNGKHAIPIADFENALASHVSTVVGRTVWDALLRKLWSFDCSAALDEFINDFPPLLARSSDQIQREKEGHDPQPHGKIARTSPLGAFIRRCHLEFTRLQFQDGILLWQDFIVYRAPTRQAWEKKNALGAHNGLDVNFSSLNIDVSHPLAQILYGRLHSEEPPSSGFSLYDIERLMEFQVSELQRSGGRLPDDMKEKVMQMSKAGTALPHLAHYLRFLDSWRAGDYTSAFDNLHRYFDYTMQSRERNFYQYALLNLAILQAEFGCYNEAIPALQEAIATARDNKDSTCLNFCMSWLYHFGKTFPVEMKQLRDNGMLGGEAESLAFLKSRAKDAEMWSLLSNSHLSEAKLALQNGDSLATVFESIVKAGHINIVKSIGSLNGPALLMKGSVYGRVGVSHLAWSCGEIFLELPTEEVPAEDVVKCTCRMASILVQRGRYDDALNMLSDIPSKILRILKYQQYTTFYNGMLKLRRYLHHNHLSAAIAVINRLKGQGAPDLELKLHLSLLQVDLLSRRDSIHEAIRLLETVAENAQIETPDVLPQVKLLNAKASLLAKCGHPLKGLTIVLRAASTAYRARLLPALWEATTNLSHILNELSEFAPAVFLLSAIVPQVLECQDCALAASVYSKLVDAHIGLAGREKSKSTRWTELVNKATEYIDLAFEQYRRLEDLTGQLDMLDKKARILYMKGDFELADDLASRWLEIRTKYKEMEV